MNTWNNVKINFQNLSLFSNLIYSTHYGAAKKDRLKSNPQNDGKQTNVNLFWQYSSPWLRGRTCPMLVNLKAFQMLPRDEQRQVDYRPFRTFVNHFMDGQVFLLVLAPSPSGLQRKHPWVLCTTSGRMSNHASPNRKLPNHHCFTLYHFKIKYKHLSYLNNEQSKQ